MNLIMLLDMVLQFSLFAQLADYDTKKHSNIVEHINWVLSELSVGVHTKRWIALVARAYHS